VKELNGNKISSRKKEKNIQPVWKDFSKLKFAFFIPHIPLLISNILYIGSKRISNRISNRNHLLWKPWFLFDDSMISSLCFFSRNGRYIFAITDTQVDQCFFRNRYFPILFSFYMLLSLDNIVYVGCVSLSVCTSSNCNREMYWFGIITDIIVLHILFFIRIT